MQNRIYNFIFPAHAGIKNIETPDNINLFKYAFGTAHCPQHNYH